MGVLNLSTAQIINYKKYSNFRAGVKEIIIITSTQSVTLTKSFTAYCIGGGGGGGTRQSGATSRLSGGGGGSGYYATGTVSAGTYTATIGAGGSTNLNSAGGTGGTTSISGVSASGGSGGALGQASVGVGGAGGSSGGNGVTNRGDAKGGSNGGNGNGNTSGSGTTINGILAITSQIGTSNSSFIAGGSTTYIWSDYAGGPGGINLYTAPENNLPGYYPDGYGYGGYGGPYRSDDTVSRSGGAGSAGVIILVEN